MNKEQREYKINRLMAMMLFLIYAACILLVLMTGAKIYKQLVKQNQNNYDQRTAIQYLTTKVRQNDQTGSVEIREFDEVTALVLKEQINEKNYETLIYCYDGYLREIFSASAKDFSPEDGTRILALESLGLKKDENAIYAEIISVDGSIENILLYFRSGEEVPDE